MSKVCELTGKARYKANRVSHSNTKTRRIKYPNVLKKKWKLPELGRSFTLTLSTSAFRTIAARGGLATAILMEKEENLSDRLRSVKRELLKLRKIAKRSNTEASHEV